MTEGWSPLEQPIPLKVTRWRIIQSEQMAIIDKKNPKSFQSKGLNHSASSFSLNELARAESSLQRLYLLFSKSLMSVPVLLDTINFRGMWPRNRFPHQQWHKSFGCDWCEPLTVRIRMIKIILYITTIEIIKPPSNTCKSQWIWVRRHRRFFKHTTLYSFPTGS